MEQVPLSSAISPFALDPADEIPLGLQLRIRLRALIATGRLPVGERLPSVRQMAEWAGVNLKTVQAVYAHLEDEGLVNSHHGRGTFVAEGAEETAPELERLAADAIQGALDAGLSPRDLADVMFACVGIQGGAAGKPEGPIDADAEVLEVRQELRRQIARLEAELVGYTRDLPADMPTAPRVGAARLVGVGELEQTRDVLVARLSEARLEAERRMRSEARRRAREGKSDRSGEDPTGPLARASGWWLDRR